MKYFNRIPSSSHIKQHGDGVKDVAFHVDDAKACYNACIERGAQSALEPVEINDENGSITHAAICTYGDTIHSFISHNDYNGPFLPGFVKSEFQGASVGLRFVDHVVGNVELGKMNQWVNFYADIMGFTPVSEAFKKNYDPEGLVELINTYLDSMTKIILKNCGTIDKYMGDCIMAFWNAPLDCSDHAPLIIDFKF